MPLPAPVTTATRVDGISMQPMVEAQFGADCRELDDRPVASCSLTRGKGEPMLTVEELRGRMQANDWFRVCSAALQDALLAHGRERRLVPGEHLFSRDADDGGLYCVQAGFTVQDGVCKPGRPY